MGHRENNSVTNNNFIIIFYFIHLTLTVPVTTIDALQHFETG